MRDATLVACVTALFAMPAAAYEVLFLGTPYPNADGSTGQVVTALMNYAKTDIGATGLIDHTDLQTGFSAQFTVNCPNSAVHVVAAPWTDQPQPPSGSGITVQVFPGDAKITFGDGQVGYVDLTSDQQVNLGVKLAADIGEKQFQLYLTKQRAKKSQSAMEVATGETGLIIANHPQLVAMLSMALIARACAPM
ncbi:MAG: hypothetical protein ABIV25_11210 [Paracoccaceae bacterium]